MTRIHKLLLWSLLKGVLVGWALLALLLILNLGGIRDLIVSSSDTVLATFLLAVGFAITFGNAAMGHAVMTIPRKKPVDPV